MVPARISLARTAIALACLVALALPATAADKPRPVVRNETPGIRVDKTGNRVLITVNWASWCLGNDACLRDWIEGTGYTDEGIESAKCRFWGPAGDRQCAGSTVAARPAQRIDKDSVVVLKSTHFNFFHYSIKYDVSEKQVESYTALSQIFETLFGIPELSIGSFGIAAADGFVAEARAWRQALARQKTVVSRTVDVIRNKPVLLNPAGDTDPIFEALVAARDVIDERRSQAESALNDILADESVSRLERMQFSIFFDQIDAVHDATAAYLQAVQVSANRTLKGQTHVIRRKDAGTLVSVAAIPSRQDDSGGQELGHSVAFDYFVHSARPLLFHAGFTASSADALSVEKVRTLPNTDLFAQVTENSSELTAMLTYEVHAFGERDQFAFGLTLGTSIKDPGNTILAGASLKLFDRFVLSGGISTTITEQGKDPIPQGIEGVRQLYQTFSRSRVQGGFIGVSLRVY